MNEKPPIPLLLIDELLNVHGMLDDDSSPLCLIIDCTVRDGTGTVPGSSNQAIGIRFEEAAKLAEELDARLTEAALIVARHN